MPKRSPRSSLWRYAAAGCCIAGAQALLMVWLVERLTPDQHPTPRTDGSAPTAKASPQTARARETYREPAPPASIAAGRGRSKPVPGTVERATAALAEGTFVKDESSTELVIADTYLPDEPLAPDSPEGESEAAAAARKALLSPSSKDSRPPREGAPIARGLRLLASDARHRLAPTPNEDAAAKLPADGSGSPQPAAKEATK